MGDEPFKDEPRVVRLSVMARCFDGPLDGVLVELEIAGKFDLPETFGEYSRDRTEAGLSKVDVSGNPAYIWRAP